jgi:ABC-type transport system involved in multi-copper enzyme maturation permease subunit
MRGALTLAAHSLRRTRALILGMGLLFGAFQALAALVAGTFEESQLFTRITALVPPYVRQAMGSSLFTMMSFSGLTALGYVHFAVIGTLVGLAIAVGTEPASEVERGFSDLLMARPVPRSSAITRSVLVLVAAATITNLLMLGGTWAGLALFARNKPEWPHPAMFLSLAAGLWALMFCWGGVGLAFGASARRRGAAGAGAGFLAVTFYLLDVVARVWEPARRAGVGRLSPFHYFNPIEPVSGRSLPLAHVAVLAAVGGAAIAAAYAVYARRDL